MAERNLSVLHTTTWHCVQRVDFGLIKVARLTERANMEFRAELFNPKFHLCPEGILLIH